VKEMKYSVIIPVYNRPEEVAELLESLVAQEFKDFEVIIVEDGSTVRCDQIIARYQHLLDIVYFYKQNEGPGPSRNFGFSRARGDYFVIFDSDCILPPHYFRVVDDEIKNSSLDAWGGPDRGHDRFTLLQRAMAYTMSSFFTTGGIRGGKKSVGAFQPRSFNMGFSRNVFERTGGFRFDRFAEDIELSIRMKDQGFRVNLIPQAFVFHKRRTNLIQFFKQVSNFGKGRVLVGAAHRGHVKLAHWFPSAFTVALVVLLLLPFVNSGVFYLCFAFLLLYLAVIFFDALIVTRNVLVAALSIPSAIVQLTGYGFGFFKESLKTYFNGTRQN
jgi:glycosyltransferase involved in cell wall biosynthesis